MAVKIQEEISHCKNSVQLNFFVVFTFKNLQRANHPPDTGPLLNDPVCRYNQWSLEISLAHTIFSVGLLYRLQRYGVSTLEGVFIRANMKGFFIAVLTPQTTSQNNHQFPRYAQNGM